MGAKNSRSELRKQSVQADTTSIMTMDRAGAKNSQANNRNEQENEPMIDFDLEQEMIGFDNEKNKAKKSKITGPTKKANLNESSDFDLDNYWYKREYENDMPVQDERGREAGLGWSIRPKLKQQTTSYWELI